MIEQLQTSIAALQTVVSLLTFQVLGQTPSVDAVASDVQGAHISTEATPTDLAALTTSGFSSGDRVVVTNRVNVRNPYGLQGAILGRQSAGAYGTIHTQAPQSASGYTWVPVNFDAGEDGWVVQNYLKLVAPAPVQAVDLLSESKVIKSSNNFGSNNPLSNLFDDCTSDRAECTTGEAGDGSFFVEFDLGALYKLSSVRLFGDTSNNWQSKSWTVATKSSARDSYTNRFSNRSVQGDRWFTEALSTEARYVRVQVNGASTKGSQANELELFGTLVGTTPTPTPTPTPVPTPTPTPTPVPTPTYPLTVSKSGSGSVTGTGISCGSDCTETVTSGTTISLTATPATGSTFNGWGGACSGSGACSVTMSQARTVTATFASAPTPAPTPTPTQCSTNLSFNESDFDNVIDDYDSNQTLDLRGSKWNNTLVKNCRIRNTSGDGIFLQDVKNVVITGCTFENIGGQAAVRGSISGGTENVTLYNNTVNGTAMNGFNFGERYNNGVDHKNLRIIKNTISNTGSSISDGSTHGMYIQAHDFEITGNTVSGSRDGNGLSVRSSGEILCNDVSGTSKANKPGIRYFSDHYHGDSNTLLINGNKVRGADIGINIFKPVARQDGLANFDHVVKNFIITNNDVAGNGVGISIDSTCNSSPFSVTQSGNITK